MSLERASAIRILSQVYPTWLPKVIASKEVQSSNLSSLISNTKQHLTRAQVPTYFKSSPLHEGSSTSHQQQTSSKPLRLQPYRQPNLAVHPPQTRSFSTTPTSPPDNLAKLDRKPAWAPPTNVSTRPVTIIGAGVIGRRLAALWASTSRPVNIYDTSRSTLDSARTYIADSLSSFCAENNTHPGTVHFASSLQDAVQNAWMVIEAVPDDLELKISLLGRLDRLVSADCIIATNASGFRSRELVSEVSRRERVLNTLYYVPPRNRCVELMGCGYTEPSLLPFLMSQMEEVKLRPKLVQLESTGLILPRIWAAIKRECLIELQNGVCKPEDIDELFRDFFGAQKGPCEKMDEVGLDLVAVIERHFLDVEEARKGGKAWAHLKWLEEEYVSKGKLGDKSGSGLLKRPQEKDEKKSDAGEVWKEHAIDLSGL